MRSCPQCSTSCDTSHQFCPSCGFPIGKVAQNQEDPLIGRTLPGGFVILELIGVGGMGRVYRAEQTNLGRTVAVKIVHPHLAGEENAVARFITEARAASRLNHPNSVAVIDFGKTQDGQLYLVMEYLRGKDLARVAYEEGPLPFRRIVDVLRQTLAALAEAHHLDIIHRDLKPENIILEPVRGGGDFVKVVDFGLAKMQQEKSQPSITSPGIVCGTPEYMSPEQGRGDPLDPRSDLYAVGVILFQLLTGKLPFEAETPTQVVLMHLSKAPPDPNQVAPERAIPKPIVDIVFKALSKETDGRFENAEQFAIALGEAMARIEASAREAGRNRCPKCGTINATQQKFCGECGASLGTPLLIAPTEVTVDAVRPFAITEPPPPSQVERRTGRLAADKLFALPFSGREDDIAWLEERRSAAKGSLSVACIAGEAGVGKTRLLQEFLAVASAGGDSVVQVGPDPAWAEVGYYTLRRAIVALAGLPDDGGVLGDWSAASVEARSGLAQIFGKTDGRSGSLSPDQRRFMAAEALRWALLRANGELGGRRVVLAVDDLHAVDGASRNALADVIGEPPLAPILLLVAHQQSFDPHWEGVPVHSLGALSGSAVARIVSTAGAGLPMMSSHRGVVPLYLEQMIRFLREHGTAPPPRLADLLALRVERLHADARRVLQAIAVTGDDACEDTVRPLLPEDTDVPGAIATLRKAGMVEQEDECWQVAHPLLREIVLATIPAAARRDLHAKAAEVCEMLGAPVEVRAQHQFFAQNSFDALLMLERISSLCAQRGDMAGTVLALRRGLDLARRELFRGELDDPERAMLIFGRKLGEALAQQGDYLDAEGVLREALDMAGPGGQDRARVLGALAHVAHGRSRNREAEAYLREALDLAKRSGSSDLISSLQDLKKSIAV
ncbi:MAG TPA: protein kinase [Polyangiaceae bacterium]|nr:protein kinase [Polyangiaceae bacterium]